MLVSGGSGAAAGLFVTQMVLGKFVLEITNYMEHYGIRRRVGERIGPQHSWNTNSRMSYIVLLGLARQYGDVSAVVSGR